jgi:lysozyme family protein
MNSDLLLKAMTPRHASDMLLRDMRSSAAQTVIDQLGAALVRQQAVELADALEGELAKARDAAAEPLAALDAAKAAFNAERQSIHARIAAFHNDPQRKDPADDERPPAAETPALQALQAALAATEQAAFPATNAVTILREQIDGLRACRPADAATLATIAMALVGGRLEEVIHLDSSH